MKRALDIILSISGLIFFSPLLIPIIILVWLQDGHNPFFISDRVGIDNKKFKMMKLRSMVMNAEDYGIDSTSSDDFRITKVGKFIRKFKLDELSQLWNVFLGHMSFVGPRPNVASETELYTYEEKLLLTVKPGITDFSSIIFSDEGDILDGTKDPDLAYNQLIRPWKSRLGILYINHQSLLLDLKLIVFTMIAIFKKEIALRLINRELKRINADEDLLTVCLRRNKLIPHPPPGMSKIVKNR